MINNDPHNRKQPFILGMIALVSGIILALFILDKVHAGDRQDLLSGAPFLISSDIDNTIYSYRVGSNVIMPMRIGFGYITPNVNDNNNAAVTFLDEFTIDYTTNNSWSDKQSVYRKGFAYDNFGIVYGELYAPNTGGITEWTTESFHVSKNQYVGVISAPVCPFYRMNDGYYQIYFRDVDINLGEAVDLGRGRYFCISIPQEHYNEFVLTSNSFNYPYLDLHVNYYDFTLNQWIGLIPVERFHELLEGYVLAYADRSLKISCNDSYVFVNASQFQSHIPTNSPTPIPTTAPVITDYVYCKMGGTYFLFDIVGSNVGNIDVQVPYNSILGYLQSEYNSISDLCIFNGFGTWNRSTGETNRNKFSIWFNADSVSSVNVFMTSSEMVDFDYIRQNVSPVQLNIYELGDTNSTMAGNTVSNSKFFVCKDSVTGKRYNIVYQYYYNATLDAAELLDSSFSDFNSIVIPPEESFPSVLSPFSYTYNSTFYKYGLLAQMGFLPQNNPIPTPTPTQGPPTPTNPPYVIIITPDPSPTPTPPFVIPTMPPWNSPENQLIPLDPDIQNDVFDEFKFRLGDNNAFELFGLLINLLPGDLMWYLWFLLFVLLVVGSAKLIIHFTGG